MRDSNVSPRIPSTHQAILGLDAGVAKVGSGLGGTWARKFNQQLRLAAGIVEFKKTLGKDVIYNGAKDRSMLQDDSSMSEKKKASVIGVRNAAKRQGGNTRIGAERGSGVRKFHADTSIALVCHLFIVCWPAVCAMVACE